MNGALGRFETQGEADPARTRLALLVDGLGCLLVAMLAPERKARMRRFKEIAGRYPQFSMVSGPAYLAQNLRLVDAVLAGIYLLFVFLLVPSLIAMVNTLAISVLERTREIGMLRAVGATQKQVRRMVLAEALRCASKRCTSLRVNPVRMAILDVVCFLPVIPKSSFATST